MHQCLQGDRTDLFSIRKRFHLVDKHVRKQASRRWRKSLDLDMELEQGLDELLPDSSDDDA